MPITRFVERLHLHEFCQYRFSFEITKYEILNKDHKISNLQKNKFPDCGKYLQLYHKIDNYDRTHNSDLHAKRADPEFDNPERRGLRWREFGNRGDGFYFANHGRFSLFNSCANLAGVRRAIICNIPVFEQSKDNIIRYKSEVYSPGPNSSEYVISSPRFIFPVAAVEYKFFISDAYFESWDTFVRDFGCEKCGKSARCDCRLPILESDIIYT